ncbi:MAG: PQQ-binding-like beta-propeller repeat protein, partial [Candidatus Bathyarchaeia archaeon]
MNLKNKNLAIALILLLTAVPILALPLAEAHTPPWSIPTYAYIVASPNPIGVGQTAFVVFWLDKVPPTAGGIGGDRWTGFTVKITAPDGTTETKGPYTSDATSAAWFLYTPTKLGTYRFDFSFPGQVASLFHPETGVRGSASDYVNDTYLPSSASTTLTVQQEAVPTPPTYPLPTSYWTRPIEGQNTEWSRIASHYLGGSSIIDAFQPYGLAPESSHILWTKPLQDGGIVGGDWPVPSAAYYTGLSYQGKFNNPIIIYGRLYYKAPLGDSQTAGPYTCVDLRTGETLWENDTINPTAGQLYLYESFNQHGVIGDGYLLQTSGTTIIVYDARTGKWLFNLTDVPSGTEMRGPSGEILRYVLNVNGKWLALWNSSAGPNTPLVLTAGNTTNAFQYRPFGKNANMSQAYTWNVTIPTLPSGSSIRRVIPGDLLLGSTSSTVGGAFGFGSQDYTVWAISLKPNNLGQLLWMKNYTAPPGNLTRSFGPVDPVNRVFTMTDKETMQWLGYDLDNGNLLWGPVGNFRAFQYYGRVSNPPAPGFVGYGNLYVGGYGGELVAFDIRTGALKWKYNNTFSGDQT